MSPGTLIVVETGRGEFGMRPLLEAKKLGLKTLLLARAPEMYGSTESDRAMMRLAVDEVLQSDTRDSGGVLTALEGREDRADYVGAFSALDYFMPMAAVVARAFGLPGADPRAVEAARNKVAMRAITDAAGVPTPPHRAVRTARELEAALRDIGLPVIVKPPADAAGIGVRLCFDELEAVSHFESLASRDSNMRGQKLDGGVLVEKYLIGMDVGIDMIDTGPERVLLGLTDEYTTGAPLFIENGETFPSVLPRAVQKECVAVAEAALDALGFHFGASHVEVKITADGPVLIEVNPRMGGGGIPEMIELATGVPAVRELLRLHVGGRPDLVPTVALGAASKSVIADKVGSFHHFNGADLAERHPGFHKFVAFASAGTPIDEAVDDRADLGYALFTGNSPGEAERRASAGVGEITAVIN